MKYSIEVRERFGYGETKYETQTLEFELVPAALANIWPWASDQEIESITDMFTHGSWDFSESDLIMPLYDQLDQMTDEADYKLIIERHETEGH